MKKTRTDHAILADDCEVWRADDLLINVSSGTVERNGEPLQITGLSFQLLTALVRSAPRCLDQSELSESVWQGRVVSPETIVQRVKLLRRALGDDAARPTYVGLVRGRGYKLLPATQRIEKFGSEPAESRSRLRYYLALGAIILLLSLLFRGGEESIDSGNVVRAGIAVLPFTSQGAVAGEADFFATGVHDDIITELARIEDLLVISRTSVLAYQNTQQPISDIGRELNVDKILEGNVQRSAGKVKINVQLIDAKADRHLWAQGYERDLSVANIITTQRQIAIDVARELHLSLSDQSAETALPTESIAAYDHYLLARQAANTAADALNQPGTFLHAQEPLAVAAKQLLAAIAEDSDFVEAHALLSTIYSQTYRSAAPKDQALLNRASAALMEAIKLDPDRPMVHLALSEYYLSIGEHKKSLVELELASRGLPQATGILMALSMRTLMAGRADEALTLAETAVARDPLNIRAATMLMIIRYFSGDLHGTLAATRRAQVLAPNSVPLAYMAASFRFAATADLPAYREAIETLPVQDTQGVRSHWEVAFLARDYTEALAVLQAGPRKPWISFAEYTPPSFLKGITHLMAGNHSMAMEAMTRARKELELVRARDPADPRALARLAGVFAALGEQQLARDTVQAAQKSAPYRNNAVFARIWRRMLIEALILNGDVDDALDLLEIASSNPGNLPIASLIARPIFDRVRTLPRFLEIVRHSPKPLPSSSPTPQQ